MNNTARRKQKRYMTSGTIQKPKNWSSRQVATRLTTLNRYLQYLPGTNQSFTEDEMKDMLVDMHSPTYQHLMARANYDIESHSYLELTQYLFNLLLIEESFNKGNANNKNHWVDALEQEILYAHNPDTTDAERIQGIIESKYTPADLSKIVEECTHLEKAEQKQLLQLLQKHEDLFDGTLGTWKTDPI